MANADILSVLYAKTISPLDFKFDSLTSPPMLSLLKMQDITSLGQIAMSNRLASKPSEKYRLIDEILKPRGFLKIASGTNRVVYKYLEDQSICIKAAIDRVGIKDNPMEYLNQFKLKPFVAKTFEVSPCGTVGLVERVEPIITREEYLHIANDVYDLLVNKIKGKYVVDDAGTNFFQNIGVRKGFGPVLLDYPYVYELDGKKLYCNRFDQDTGSYCLGEIDYDAGFNMLVCTKCGKEYQARQLSKQVEDRNIIIKMEGVTHDMSIRIMRGDEVVEVIETVGERSSISPTPSNDHKPKVWNKRNFDQRQHNKETNKERQQRQLQKAKKKRDDTIHKNIDRLSDLYKPGNAQEAIVNNEPQFKEVDASDLAHQQNPNYMETGRFERRENPLKRPDDLDPNSQNSNTSVEDYRYDTSAIKKPDDTHEDTDDKKTEISENVVSYADGEDIEEEPTKEELASSSWESPVEVDSFGIEVDEDEDSSSDEDTIADMY